MVFCYKVPYREALYREVIGKKAIYSTNSTEKGEIFRNDYQRSIIEKGVFDY